MGVQIQQQSSEGPNYKVEYEEYIARLEAMNAGLNRQLILQSIVNEKLRAQIEELEGKVITQNGSIEPSNGRGNEENEGGIGRTKQGRAVISG